MLIARSKHHRQVIATLQLRILPKEDSCSLCLLVLPFALGFEQQVPAPGQKLFGGIPILVHDWGIGLAGLPYLFEVFVLLLESRAPQLDPNVLHRLGNKLLNMEAIRHQLGTGKGLRDRQFHIRRHIHGHLGYGVPRANRESGQDLGDVAGFRALDHRHEGTLPAVGRLVRQRGPELAVRHGHFVDAQMRAKVLWKEHPVFRVLVLLPGCESTQVVFILLFKLLRLQLVGSRNGGERDRLSLRLLLLKNPQTPSPTGSQGNRVGSHVSDTRPGLPTSNSAVGRSAACVSLATESQ